MDTNLPLQKITRNDGVTLAYRLRPATKTAPTLVFLPGYQSDMEGTKALAVDAFCAREGYGLLRLDYSGHGQSGGEFRDGTIGQWTDDALTIINAVTSGPLILIGSSMGGWIGLLLAQELGDRIKGFIGIAAAPDFTDWVWNRQMTEEQRESCHKNGYIESGGDMMTLNLFEDGAQNLVLDKPLHMPYPVTLLQGKQDTEVPYKLAEKLAAHITPGPVNLILVDDGDHRLSRDADITLLIEQIKPLLTKV